MRTATATGEQRFESDPSGSQQPQRPVDAVTRAHEILFIEDVARLLRTSTRTIKRRLRAGTFPIPELPRIDHRHRWSLAVVSAWIARAEHKPRLVRPSLSK